MQYHERKPAIVSPLIMIDDGAFWRDFTLLPRDQHWSRFLLLAASVLDAVDAGQLTVVAAGKALAPAWDYESLMIDGNMIIAASLASELAGNCFESVREAEHHWQQLRSILMLYL